MESLPINSDMQRADAIAAGYVTGTDAAEIVGITYRRVNHAARIGIAPPTVVASGSGRVNCYDLGALTRLKVMADLYGLGLSGVGRSVKSRRADLIGLLDRIDYDGGPASLRLGSVTVIVDPAGARRTVEPGYRAVVGRERVG